MGGNATSVLLNLVEIIKFPCPYTTVSFLPLGHLQSDLPFLSWPDKERVHLAKFEAYRVLILIEHVYRHECVKGLRCYIH